MRLLYHQHIFTLFSANNLRIVITFIILLNAFEVPAQKIGTIAGNGSPTSSGNGSAATCAGVPSPSGICVDANGDLFIVSPHSIRKINASSGIISTIAGFTNIGFSGDGGPSTAALLDYPRSICKDPSGNIFIAEQNGHRIRKIDANTGIITTIAGNGTAGYSGDGGPATSAMLNTPYDIKTDNMGNLYVADYLNSRIRKINLASGIISSIAGNGAAIHSGDGGAATLAGIALPTSVCTDAMGNIYFAEVKPAHSTRIRKISVATGIISTIAGSAIFSSSGDGGSAIQATMMRPYGICTDASGNIYFSDFEAARIRKINMTTGIISTLAGSGSTGYGGDGNAAAEATLSGPFGICADNSGNIFFSDNGNNRVRKIYVNLTSPPSTPSIAIAATSTSACSDIPVVFTAIVSNGSANMIYQWYRNGTNVGTNSKVYAPTSLNHGDVISCVLTSSGCNGVVAIKSNQINITGSVIPSITISASSTIVCPGTTIQFTATAFNCGPNPKYQWKVNGMEVGSNLPNYSRVLTSSGDNITCELTPDPSISCITRSITYSNQIGITVTSGVQGSIDISASDNNVCPGTPITFTAKTHNAGVLPSYQWKVNGSIVGGNQPNFTSLTFLNKDEVMCVLTSGGSNNCISIPSPSPVVVVYVKNTPEVLLIPVDTTVLYGSEVQLSATIKGHYASYVWQPATRLINSTTLTPATTPLRINTAYQFTVSTAEGCEVTAKSIVKVKTTFMMPNAFTPNGDGLNDLFILPNSTSFKLISFAIYDRWGNTIFNTTDAGKGWDGSCKGIKKQSGTYIYFIQLYDGDKKIVEKGSVILLR